ncbi:MAG: TOBE domain-containing protein, partial [Geminicoccaceae bacterium]|nr:TOBE domain-containing protein [Geminicoccaceae bacterium]
NATVVYVTHDQLEAMTMADRMAVMSGGVLQQYDTPDEVFAHPLNTFVAGFVGSPAMNLLQAEVAGDGAAVRLQGDGWSLPLSQENAGIVARARSRKVVMGARHGTIGIGRTESSEAAPAPDAVPAKVYTVEPTGDITYVHIDLGGQSIVASAPPSTRLAANDRVFLSFDQARLHLFDGETQETLARPEGRRP